MNFSSMHSAFEQENIIAQLSIVCYLGNLFLSVHNAVSGFRRTITNKFFS